MSDMGYELSAAREGGLDMALLRERVAAASSTLASAAPSSPELSRAAVAAVLRNVGKGPEVLLIRRAERARDPWSGHMAFPGGREDASDESLYRTAVRETWEEVALDLERDGRLLGCMAPIPAVARGRDVGMTITPFVFELHAHAPLQHKSDEVVETLWAALDPLFRGEQQTTIPYELSGTTITLPAFDIQGRVVWGLTYRMLENLFGLVR